MFWYGAWRGFIIGTVYSLIAVFIAELVRSTGFSTGQSVWSGIIASQVTMLVLSRWHFKHLQKHHEISRCQTQARLVEQLAKILMK